MPGWIIERFNGEEVHIHFWDFATDAIEDALRERCRRNGWNLTARTRDDSLVKRHLFISKEGRSLLRIHTTSCSTPSDSYICVHLQPDDASLDLLVDLFRDNLDSGDVAIYGKIYKTAPLRRPAAA